MLNSSNPNSSERSLEQISQEMRSYIADLLKIDVGFEEDGDLFELGFHSLLAVKLIEWVQRTLFVRLGVRELYINPTLRDLAEVVYRNQGTRGG